MSGSSANNLTVVVLTPTGRRDTVKCTSNTTILQILEQTCTKYNFQPEEYDLTHHRHVLDTSSTFRFSGLPNNAQLEMVKAKTTRKESEVVLGLQLESGERKMGNFSPSANLHTVIATLAPEQSDPETHPVVIYMRTEVYGDEALKNTTLKSLGLTGGKAMVRLIHRTPEQLKTQANVSSPLVAKPKDIEGDISFNSASIFSSTQLNEPIVSDENVEDDNNYKTATESNNQTNTNSVLNETFNSESQNETNVLKEERMDTGAATETTSEGNTDSVMETDKDVTESYIEEDDSRLEDEIVVLGERNALVFSLDMSSQLPYDDLPDDFYDLSMTEVKRLFQDLTHKREEMENSPLQITAMKKLEEDKITLCQLRDYKKVVLRIAFPDRTVLQGTFQPLDTIKTVMDFVKHYLDNAREPFDLYLSPPKQILNPETRLLDAKCIPSALLHFGPHVDEAELPSITSRRYLKSEILDKLTSPEAAKFSACKSRGLKSEKVLSPSAENKNNSSSFSKPGEAKKHGRSELFSVPGPSKGKVSKVPKWFKPV